MLPTALFCTVFAVVLGREGVRNRTPSGQLLAWVGSSLLGLMAMGAYFNTPFTPQNAIFVTALVGVGGIVWGTVEVVRYGKKTPQTKR